MAITPESPATVSPPNTLTSESAGSVAVPNTLTAETAGSVAVPNTLTAETAGSVAVPNTLTAESAASVAVPNTLTAETAGSVAVPNTLTQVSASTMPRTVCPTLGLDFAESAYSLCGVPKTLSDITTYSRSSSATFINRRVNSYTGQYEYFVDNDYVGSVTNLLTYSEQFDNADWVKAGSSVVDSSNKEVGPLGTGFADKISSGGGSFDSVDQTVSTSGNVTLSVYVKDIDSGELTFRLKGTGISGATGVVYKFYLNSLTAVRQSGASVDQVWQAEPVGKGWLRLSLTVPSTTITEVSFFPAYNSSDIASVYLWGAQLTQSDKITPYVQTLGASASDTFTESPRIEYNPETGENLGVLIERSEVNLLTYSEDLLQWSTAGTVFRESNAGTAPDGSNSADVLNVNQGVVNRVELTTSAATTPMVFSCYVKAVDADKICLRIAEASGVEGLADFSFTTESFTDISNLGTTFVQKLSNDWYRVGITLEGLSSAGTVFARLSGAQGAQTGTKTLVWGMQLESTRLMSSYIPTFGSTVARASDNLSVSQSYIAGLNNATVSVEADLIDFPSGDGRTRNAYNLLGDNSTESYVRVSSTGDLQNNHGDAVGNRTIANYGSYNPASFKTVFTYDRSLLSRKSYVEGVEVHSETTTEAMKYDPSDSIYIGSYDGTGAFWDGHVKTIKFYPVEMTAAEVGLL